MSLEAALFWIFALAACGSALAVVLTENVVRMAFWLVVSLAAVGGLFFLLHADFLGATQLLIYVGGTVVLLIFGVMLTASAAPSTMKTPALETLLGLGAGGVLLLMLVSTFVDLDWDGSIAQRLGPSTSLTDSLPRSSAQQGNTTRPLGMAMLGLRPDELTVDHQPARSGYLLPFEIVSVHLLIVLIGAAYLARAKRRRTGSDESL